MKAFDLSVYIYITQAFFFLKGKDIQSWLLNQTIAAWVRLVNVRDDGRSTCVWST